LAHLHNQTDLFVSVILAGKQIGNIAISDLLPIITQARIAPESRMIIHQMLGHAPEHLTKLAKVLGGQPCLFWLHDFFSLCPSYNLLRNDISFCSAPDQKSNACGLCIYGEERPDHGKRIAEFFTSVDMHILAPSAAVADFWSKHNKLPVSGISILPHVKLVPKQIKNLVKINSNTPVTIGFLGLPTFHKGWGEFEQLLSRFKADTRYRFVHFSAFDPITNLADHIRVQVTANDPQAMIKAIKAEKTDLVLHWANCFETFSLSCFEALAAGAFVVTNKDSGNVAAKIGQSKRGAVLADSSTLLEFFDSQLAVKTARLARKMRSKQIDNYVFGRLSFEIINQKGTP